MRIFDTGHGMSLERFKLVLTKEGMALVSIGKQTGYDRWEPRHKAVQAADYAARKRVVGAWALRVADGSFAAL